MSRIGIPAPPAAGSRFSADAVVKPGSPDRVVWSVAATLPHRPCLPSGTVRSGFPTGHRDNMREEGVHVV